MNEPKDNDIYVWREACQVQPSILFLFYFHSIFIVFYSILFYSILFYSILFYFYSIFILFLFYFYSIFILFLFYFYSFFILFLFFSILFILFYFAGCCDSNPRHWSDSNDLSSWNRFYRRSFVRRRERREKRDQRDGREIERRGEEKEKTGMERVKGRESKGKKIVKRVKRSGGRLRGITTTYQIQPDGFRLAAAR